MAQVPTPAAAAIPTNNGTPGNAIPIVGRPVGAPAAQVAAATPSPRVPLVASTAPPFMMYTPSSQRDRWLKILIYGTHGAGKTTLANSACDVPEMCNVLFVDAERGDLTLEDNPRIKNTEGISRVEVSNTQSIGFVHQFLKSHCFHRDAGNIDAMRKNEALVTGVPEQDIQTPKIFKTVVVDSITEIDLYNMNQLLGISQDAIISGTAGDIEVADWPIFRKNNMMLQLLVRSFRDLQMHVILTCQRGYHQDENKAKFYGPALTGQLARQVQGLVDIVGHLQTAREADEQGNIPRFLAVQPTPRFDAKCRRANFKGPGFQDPTMSSILAAVGLLGKKA